MQVYPQDFKDDFEDDVLEEYGNIIGNKGQATSPQDQKLANTLRNSNFKNLTPRIHWPMREIKPISEFGNTKLFCLAFPWLFPGGIGHINESRLVIQIRSIRLGTESIILSRRKICFR